MKFPTHGDNVYFDIATGTKRERRKNKLISRDDEKMANVYLIVLKLM